MSLLGYAFSKPKPGKYLLYEKTRNNTAKRYVLEKNNYILGTYQKGNARVFTYLEAKRMQSGKLRLEKL